MTKKFSRQRKRSRGKKPNTLKKNILLALSILPVRQNRVIVKTYAQRQHHFYIPPLNKDRVTYVYEVDELGNCVKVVSVSHSVEINGKWYPILWLDSEHGYLECHVVTSMNDPRDTVSWTKESGYPGEWLTLAVNYVMSNLEQNRKSFLVNSHVKEDY